MKQKRGTVSALTKMKNKEEELGKAMKRKAINRAKEEESKEEIVEYIYGEDDNEDRPN